VWAHKAAREYFDSGEAGRRLEQRSRDLFPWVDESMRLVRPDRWLDEDTEFTMGVVRFEVHHLGPAHSPEDVIIVLPREGVVFSGDILFAGRERIRNLPADGARVSREVTYFTEKR
jgi:glyoxylase-like metal-dependent hydrolase (beta-lactamase superfamily II)